MGKILFPRFFPHCPTNGSEYIIPDYTFVNDSDLASAMKTFWRPYKIKLSGSYTKFNEVTRLCDITDQYFLVIKSPYETEEDMVCEPVRQWVLDSSYNIVDAENSFSWDSKVFYKNDDNKDRYFSLNQFGFQMVDGCNLGVLMSQLSPTDSNGGPYAYTTIDFLGVSYNVATYTNEFGFSYVVPNIEVISWWSYGGTYDMETGDRL
jgi:hypothetical protein